MTARRLKLKQTRLGRVSLPSLWRYCTVRSWPFSGELALVDWSNSTCRAARGQTRWARANVRLVWVMESSEMSSSLVCVRGVLHNSYQQILDEAHMVLIGCTGTAGLNWHREREADRSSMTSRAQIAGGRLKPAVLLRRERARICCTVPPENPNDIKTALMYEDDEWTTCRKNLLWDKVCSPTEPIQPRAQNTALLQAHNWYLLN